MKTDSDHLVARSGEAPTAALRAYANPFNWDVDDQGIRRIWLEPGVSTPTAYNGFELAAGVLRDEELTAMGTQPPNDQIDYEAIAWAYRKLGNFGVLNNTEENALMADRLNAMLLFGGAA